MPISRVTCPKCGMQFDTFWLPYPAPDFRLGKKYLRKCPQCGKRSHVNVVDTQISPD